MLFYKYPCLYIEFNIEYQKHILNPTTLSEMNVYKHRIDRHHSTFPIC